jgi:hypothetical protein
MDMINTMLISYDFGEILYFSCYIIIRIPYKNLDKMPYEF